MFAKLKKTSNQFHEQAKFLVVKFLKNPKGANWGNEIKISNFLIKKYGFEVFNALDLDFKLNSLAFFRTENGIETIKKQQREQSFVFEDVQSFEFSEEKIGEDKIIESKPKSILEFIK